MYKYTLSVISAILMGISQQPFGLGFLSWFSLFPFLFIIENQTNFKDIINYLILMANKLINKILNY